MQRRTGRASSSSAETCPDVLDRAQIVKILLKSFTSGVKVGCQNLFLTDAEVHRIPGCQKLSDV